MSARKYFSKIGWIYAIYIFTVIGLQLGLGILIIFLPSPLAAWLSNTNVLLLLSQGIMYGVAFPVFALLMRKLPPCRMTEPKEIGFKHFLALVVFCVGAVYIGNLVGSGLMKLVELLTGTQTLNPVDDLLGEMDVLMVALTTVVIAPVMEELMFRKYLVDRLVPYGQKTAVVLSGIIFALFHGNFYQFFYAAVLGMIFAYIYSSTGRIRYPIILHMIINFVGGVLSLVLVRGADSGSAAAYAAMLIFGLVCLACIIASIVMLCIYLRCLPWFEGWVKPERGTVSALIGASGMWALLAAGICLFLLG